MTCNTSLSPLLSQCNWTLIEKLKSGSSNDPCLRGASSKANVLQVKSRKQPSGTTAGRDCHPSLTKERLLLFTPFASKQPPVLISACLLLWSSQISFASLYIQHCLAVYLTWFPLILTLSTHQSWPEMTQRSRERWWRESRRARSRHGRPRTRAWRGPRGPACSGQALRRWHGSGEETN